MRDQQKHTRHAPQFDPRLRAEAFLVLAAPLLDRLAERPPKDANRRDRFMTSVEQIQAIADGRFTWVDDEHAPAGCRGPAYRLGPSHGIDDLRLALISEAAREASIDDAALDAATVAWAATVDDRISILTDYMATLPEPRRGHWQPPDDASPSITRTRPPLYDDPNTREVSPLAIGPADHPIELDTDAIPEPPPISPEAVLVAAATYIDEAERVLEHLASGIPQPGNDAEQRTLEDHDVATAQPIREAMSNAETILFRAAVRLAPMTRWPGRADQRRRDRAMLLARDVARQVDADAIEQARIANGLQEIPHHHRPNS